MLKEISNQRVKSLPKKVIYNLSFHISNKLSQLTEEADYFVDLIFFLIIFNLLTASAERGLFLNVKQIAVWSLSALLSPLYLSLPGAV